MSALSFPTSPALYDSYTVGSQSWYWDGTTWRFGAGPGAVDPSFASVTFLCNMTGAGRLVNLGSAGGALLIGNGTYSETTVKNWPVSMLVSAQSAYGMSSSTAWTFGTGDFTLDMWINPNALAAKNFFDFRTSGASICPCLYMGADGSVNYFVNNATVITGAASALVVGTWSEIELSRVSGTTRLFVNGTQTGSNYTDSNNYTQAGFTVGNGNTLNSAIGESGPNAYIGACRITKGVGRHTANYTPGNGSYPTH